MNKRRENFIIEKLTREKGKEKLAQGIAIGVMLGITASTLVCLLSRSEFVKGTAESIKEKSEDLIGKIKEKCGSCMNGCCSSSPDDDMTFDEMYDEFGESVDSDEDFSKNNYEG